MYDEFFRSNVSFERFFEPTRRFQALLVDNAEKVANFQFDAAKGYADLGLKNLREGLAISDAKEFQSYVSRQSEVARTVADKVKNDTQTFVGIQQDFGQEWQKLFQDNVNSFAAEAKAAGQKAADAAAAGSSRKSA